MTISRIAHKLRSLQLGEMHTVEDAVNGALSE